MTSHERDAAWAEEHVPELYAQLGALLIGNISMARAMGSLDADTVRARAKHQYGVLLEDSSSRPERVLRSIPTAAA